MSWPPTTASIDLSGTWSICPDDPDRHGVDRWWLRSDAPDDWRPIDLPAAWQTVLGTDSHGVVWLRRLVDVPAGFVSSPAGRRLWLRFESAATEVSAWVNGTGVGHHLGDFVPFRFEVTEAVGHSSTIDLVLRVDELHAAPPDAPGQLQNGHITKGFHDVISMQHGGVWQPLHLAATDDLCAIPDGVGIHALAESGEVHITAELEPRRRAEGGRMDVVVFGPDGEVAASRSALIDPTQRSGDLSLRVESARLWSPFDPALYRAHVTLGGKGGVSEEHHVRFGFRAARADGTALLFNGAPLFIRGVLHWGHEPDTIAPAPTPKETRDLFMRLRERGFNCVCLCMWYPPRHFFEIADETGMLIWQIHPVWQSPMRGQDLDEYKRLYRSFLRRDRNHPSVTIVSATCEHPSFEPRLAAWWWETSRDELPGTLRQVQSAFFKWADLERTDFYDEHTYENSDRWVTYLDDVQAHIGTLAPKPFVMGETVLFTSWPDLPRLRERIGDARPWWFPRCFDHMEELEAAWTGRFGAETVARFRRQGERYHLLGRKFQVEQLRRYGGNAGVVMNHLRDVPQCQCGLHDDLNRWRFDPAACRGWLADAAILLWTQEHRRGFFGGRQDEAQLALSNFSGRRFAGFIEVQVDPVTLAPPVTSPELRSEPKSVSSVPIRLPLPITTTPTRMRLVAEAAGVEPNSWDLWVFPAAATWPSRVFRFDAMPLRAEETKPDDVELGYSRGYGLPAKSWQCVFPDPATLAGDLPPWSGSTPMPGDVLLTHRLTEETVDWLLAGGRVVLLASKAAGGLGTSYEWLFGQVPLVIEEGPIQPGDSEWLIDLLGYDLTHRYARVIPVENLGIADQVDSLIRLVYTHDQWGSVRFFDQLFMTRVGDGLLIVSSLDHSEDAGQWLLRQIVAYAAHPQATTTGALDPDLLRRWTVERVTAG
jgi:hypothetical protein